MSSTKCTSTVKPGNYVNSLESQWNRSRNILTYSGILLLILYLVALSTANDLSLTMQLLLILSTTVMFIWALFASKTQQQVHDAVAEMKTDRTTLVHLLNTPYDVIYVAEWERFLKDITATSYFSATQAMLQSTLAESIQKVAGNAPDNMAAENGYTAVAYRLKIYSLFKDTLHANLKAIYQAKGIGES